MKVPRKKNGYANGGPVEDKKATETPAQNPAPKPAAVSAFSWDDYNQRLGAWENPSAQFVPQDIAQYQSKWIVPSIKTYQTTLNQALATKYKLQQGQAPAENQFLTASEAAAALGGQEKYGEYLKFVSGYQQYRQKTAGSYNAPTATAGTMDLTGEAYGYRHYGLLSLTPQQQQQNTSTTQQVRPAVLQPTAVPGMKNGGKVMKNGYAEGGPVLTPEQQAYFDTLGTDEAKNQFLSTIMSEPVTKASGAASGVFSGAGGQLPFAMIGATAGNVLDKSVQLDPNNKKRGFFNENQEEVKAAGVGALKGAGTGAAIGANPLLMAATGGLSLPIAAAGGALIGGGVGWAKGKKLGNTQDAARNLDSQRTAMSKSFTGMKDGGKVVGPGTGRSDDVPADIRQGSFIVPAKNAKLAQKIRKQFLGDGGKVADTDQSGSDVVPVYLSNGEHLFTPEEADMLVNTHGINLDALAPDSDKKMGYGYQNGGYVSAHKAKKMLKDGTIRGNKMTDDQMKYFGWIAGGRKGGYKDGGEVDGGGDPKKEKKISDKKFKVQEDALSKLSDAKDELSELKKNIDNLDKDVNSPYYFDNLTESQKSEMIKKAQSRVDAAQKYYDATRNADYYYVADNGNAVFDPSGSGAPKPEAQPEPMVTAAELAKQNQAKSSQNMVFDAAKGQYVTPSAETPATQATGTRSGVFSGGGGEKPMTADLKAIQDRFIAAHGGIDSGDPTTAEPTKIAKETLAIDDLKKQWRELTDAGKVGEAQAIEDQMKQLGYRYEYNPSTKSSDWVSAAGKSIGAQGVFQQTGDLTTAAETPEQAAAAANLPGANIKKVYDALGGAGGLLGLGQVAVGMIQSAKEKRPIDNVDPLLVQRRDEAIKESMYGFEPQEMSAAKQDIATQRSNVFGMIKETAGGNVGAGSANARMAALDANKAALNLSAADVRMREQKKGRADQLTQNVAESRRRVFQDSLGAFQQNQAASAELIGAGLSNIFGAIQAGQNQKASDERADKYGNVFMGSPTTP